MNRPSGRTPLDVIASLLESTPYRVLELIGRGGMGEVYRVKHDFLEKQFALKVLRSGATSPDLIDRVRIEAQAAARLRHPNVVEVVDFWLASKGEPCVIMELLRGRTLAEEMSERGALPPAEAVQLACQALSGLSAAHAMGVLHRDIKPENLFLHNVASRSRVLKILDFGLARVVSVVSERTPSPLVHPTATGMTVGSPRFQSPEARRGRAVDQRADLCSLGLVLYEMLTCRGPFDGGDVPKPPSYYATAPVPPGLDACVLKAIEDRADARYATAVDFRDALLAELHNLERPA